MNSDERPLLGKSMRSVWAICALAAVTLSCDRQREPDAAVQSAQASPRPTIVDDAAASQCVLDYTCGLSHPGLGSSSQTSSVDLATCTRILTSYSEPYEATPTPPARDASTHHKSSATLSAEQCARIRQLLLAITEDDARRAQESAQVDTTACTLTLTCAGASAPKLSVQRQTTSGASRIEQLIRAMRPS